VCISKGIVGGMRGCTGLTERGFAQARALRDRLAREDLTADVLLASTLPRAYQTAETISGALGIDVVRDAALCEHVPGEIDGTPWKSWESFDVLANPDRPFSPGGESLTEFWNRVRSLLDGMAAAHDGKTVVAATHGGVVWASLELLIGPGHPGGNVGAEFTSITEWSLDGDGWTLVRYNDFEHLDGRGLLDSRPS
jgi:probable phosphoglycerate mutase